MPYRMLLSLLFLSATHPFGADNSSECFSGSDLAQLRIPAPLGFSVTSACDVHDAADRKINLTKAKSMAPNSFDRGTYTYRGAITLTGTIRKENDGPLGTMVYFSQQTQTSSPDRKENTKISRLQKFTLLKQISLDDNSKIGTTRLKVVSENDAWCAKATLSFRELSIFIADTEGEGPGAIAYDVVYVGRYRKCGT